VHTASAEFIHLYLFFIHKVIPLLNSRYRYHHLSNRFPPVVFCKYRPYRLFYVSYDTALAPGLLLPQFRAASGIALLPLPGWASLWLLFALSTLSSLRQAKIN